MSVESPKLTLIEKLRALPEGVRQYLIVTGNYWAFTLTDGALRMLVVLHFHSLGFAPLAIAMLFLFYEFFGVVTNLVGGWLGARLGLNRTMNIGLFLQVLALVMLLVPADWLTVAWVMAAQALSGIAKDLNKMSAKSSIKLLVPKGEEAKLYGWVAALTGSKNALKGAGFFLGGLLLTLLGFQGAVLAMAVMLLLVWLFSLAALKRDLGRAKNKPKFSQMFSKSRSVNLLSAARLFLFGARDVWFVVALPVFLAASLGWDHWRVGGFLALWVIGYGMVQGFAPRLTGRSKSALADAQAESGSKAHAVPDGQAAFRWALLLLAAPLLMALMLSDVTGFGLTITQQAYLVIGGLLLFGVLFAVNSSLHSYLIVSYARDEGVSMDIGFYYMANAAGRLLGTVLSGWLFQAYGEGVSGLTACLWISALMLLLTVLISLALPRHATE